jgi:type I restriction enzyme M protein
VANHHELSNFIWQIADLLRGPYRPPQYERVMLPMTVLRRFDAVLAPTKEKVLREFERHKDKYKDDALDKLLNKAAGQRFHNHSPLTFEKLKGDPDNIDKHLASYINGFSANVRRIFEFFEFTSEIERMRDANILYLVVSKFCDVDLHPDKVDNIEMGLVFENLIRRFNELANETAGDHFTPREVINLMVNLLFIHDDELLATPGTVRKLLDPTCGTGGMLAEAQKYLHQHHAQAELYVYGQDYNKRSFAVAASDLLIKTDAKENQKSEVRYGDSLISDPEKGDQFSGDKFDYHLANPPFGVDWKKQAKEIEDEHDKLGFAGRFGAGLPRVNDGALLFIQHMISKFEPVQPENQKHGSRLAIVFNGSPMFTGGAGSGESDIRKWIIENDWLEAIVALPEQMFYNTGIGTYIWIVTNRKEKRRKGKIQLYDAREIYVPMRRSLGDKRRKIGDGTDGEPDQIADIVREYGQLKSTERNKIFDNADFGYTRVTVERPLRLRLELNADAEAKWLVAVEEAHQKDSERMAAPDELKIWFHGILSEFKRKAWLDWNVIAAKVAPHLEKLDDLGTQAEREFRRFFVLTDPEAERVIFKTEPMKKGAGVSEKERLAGWFEDKDGDGQRVRVRYIVDTQLRDFENVPLKEDVDDYFRREVLPHVPDAWMDRSKDKVGYEITFNRHFYKYTPPRPLEKIDADLEKAENEILQLLKEVTA